MIKLTLLALVFSVGAHAQLRCMDKLLPLPRPSAGHQLVQGEWLPQNTDALTEQDAIHAVSALLYGKLLCLEGEVSMERIAYCAPLDPASPKDVTCLLRTSLGKFYITQDFARNANLSFHRNPPVIE
jgi:hypothetical protein